jgi:hypothetical protein
VRGKALDRGQRALTEPHDRSAIRANVRDHLLAKDGVALEPDGLRDEVEVRHVVASTRAARERR